MNLKEFAKEILPVVQAASQGKKIEWRMRGSKCNWITKHDTPSFFPEEEYRIKPEPTYRPYTREEFIEKCLARPLVNKVNGDVIVPVIMSETLWYTGESSTLGRNLKAALDGWTHLDGSPCGVEVEPCKTE